MESNYLREFLDLARTCNFQQSAENTHISASSLSKHISKQEEELGVPLFDRSTRTVALNEYGKILLDYASEMVRLEDECTRKLQNALTIEQSVLRIGFLPLMGNFGILEIVSEFHNEHPDIEYQITEGSQLTERLLDNQFDFIFVDSWAPKDKQISRVMIMQDHLVAIFPEDHPLASAESVTIDQLRSEDILLQVESAGPLTITSKRFLSLCRQQGFEPKIAFKSRYISTIAKMIEQDGGVAILNSSEIRGVNDYKYSVVDIDPLVPFNIYVEYISNRIHTESARTFLRYMKAWGKKH